MAKKKNENKTQKTDVSAEDFIESLDNEKRKEEALELLKLFKSATKQKPRMWGPSIIGFGSYHYVYESGREGDWMLTGFSPRKAKHSIYLMTGFEPHRELLDQLGKFKTAKCCLYINKLEDIDLKVLKKLIQESYELMKKRNG